MTVFSSRCEVTIRVSLFLDIAMSIAMEVGIIIQASFAQLFPRYGERLKSPSIPLLQRGRWAGFQWIVALNARIRLPLPRPDETWSGRTNAPQNGQFRVAILLRRKLFYQSDSRWRRNSGIMCGSGLFQAALMLPTLVLVGRPNVGKSTLFNRLTRSRDALVADQPGLTRDRHYGRGRVGDRPYLVVDTGGLEPVAKDGILYEMAKQSRQAVDEADMVLFLVDGRAGCTPQDAIIAEQLRKTGKPILLLVNKAEGMQRDCPAMM